MTEHRAESAMILPTTTTTDHDTVHAPVALLPIGSFEQHGPYLPLVADTLIATAIADAISRNYTTFQLPPITFACSHEHSDFAGTVSISATTLAALVGDICRSLRQQDVNALIVVNGHGGNYVPRQCCARSQRRQCNSDRPVSEPGRLDRGPPCCRD